MESMTLRCYGDLADLADADRDGLVQVPVGTPRSIGSIVQGVGIPHTEVDLVVVDRTPVGWDQPVGPGQRAAVYPPFTRLPAGVESPTRPPPPHPLRFACDGHLARLADLLGARGHDVWFATDVTGEELAERAAAAGRVVVTRDPRPLLHPNVRHGVLLRTTDPREQLLEVAERFLRAPVTPAPTTVPRAVASTRV